MFGRLARLEQLSGGQAVTIGKLRKALRTALDVVTRSVGSSFNPASLYAESWYREAKALLGAKEDKDDDPS